MCSMWGKWSLNKKILFSFTVVVAIGIMACFFTFARISRVRTLEQICETKIDLLKNISDKETYIFDNIFNISNTFLIDTDVQEYLKMNPNESEYNKLQKQQIIEEKISDKLSVFSNIEYSISLLGFGSDAYLSNSQYYTREMNEKRMKEYKGVLSEIGYQLAWTNAVKHGNQYVITAMSYIPDSRNGEPLGMVILDFPEEVFAKIYKEYVNLQENLFIMNEKGNVISSSEERMIGKTIEDTRIYEEIKGYQEGYYYDKKAKSLITFVENPTAKTYIISTVPYEKLMEPYQNFLRSLPVIVIVIFLLCVVVSRQISKSISRPIQELAEQIHMYGTKHEMPERNNVKEDEISYLTQEYHFMIQRLEHMIERIYEEQEQKRKYEIEVLKGQIRPHFLYNTLISIRYLNLTEQREEVDQSLAALSNILVVYFKDKSSWQSVEKEMEFLKNYCYIQQIRYGNNFDTMIEYEEEISEVLLPKMILQPIVENAVFHGLSSYESGGKIYVKAKKEGEFLDILIKDNGVGFHKGKELKKTERHGIGVENVKERLKLIYGGAASMSLESEKGKGTEVRFIFPLNWEENVE